MSAVNPSGTLPQPSASERTANTYSISELAQEFALTTRAIRFYEDEGLLAVVMLHVVHAQGRALGRVHELNAFLVRVLAELPPAPPRKSSFHRLLATCGEH